MWHRYKDTDKLQIVREWKKIHLANTNSKKTIVAIVVSK